MSVAKPGSVLFSVLFTAFADYKKTTGQAEIIDDNHYLSKWYDVKGCFTDNPVPWTEK